MKRVGPYEVFQPVGRGGMGEVYLGRDVRDGRTVAVKILDTRLNEERENFAERFRREGELLRSIHHRTLSVIFEVGISPEGVAYLAMEYLRGEPLTRWIGASALETLPLLIQFCEGLRELASRGVVHRDLSPDNVLVVRQGRSKQVKIIDFGIAKEIGRTTELTSTGFFFGKLQYCSPEHVGMLSEGESIDWRSDLYSFGVVAYHLLAGRLPFHATTPLGLVGAHLYETPRRLDGRAGFPRRLADLLARLLEKRRERRPASYDEVIRILALSHAQIFLGSRAVPQVIPEIETDSAGAPAEEAAPDSAPLAQEPGSPSEHSPET